jgi:phosphoribosylamine-glycine ligase
MKKNLANKRLLLLGGSLWKKAIQDFAQEQGIILIATGNNHNAGIFEIADECYDVDSTNTEAMKQLIREKRIDGVYMGGSESVISTACGYLQELGLPCYCTREQWEYLQNKEHFKRLCIEYGLPVVPKYDYEPDICNNISFEAGYSELMRCVRRYNFRQLMHNEYPLRLD